MTITKKLITDFSNERLFINFILYIYNLKINTQIKKNLFKLPKMH